jgi:two-component system nitrogen regulation response regulator NtrX
MGAGKELVARTLHAMSTRASGPFVVLSAATMAPERLEESLFGIEQVEGRGRPWAPSKRPMAGHSTSMKSQICRWKRRPKILRVLLDQTFQRVGGTKKVKVDVRILSSTARDLQSAIVAQTFREDLYHRLSVVPVRVPALSERREDIPCLFHILPAGFSGVRPAGTALC